MQRKWSISKEKRIEENRALIPVGYGLHLEAAEYAA